MLAGGFGRDRLFFADHRRAKDRRARNVVDEFEVGHLRRVAWARADLDDARVAARAVGKARRHLGEELVDDLLLAQEGNACRRAWMSPRRPSVTIFSANGRTPLAFATVVLMRPWTISEPVRFA